MACERSDLELQLLARTIVRAVGGRDNVLGLRHCYSKLRLHLVDDDLADLEALRDACGDHVVSLPGELKIFIGPDVFRLFDRVVPLVHRPKPPSLWVRLKGLFDRDGGSGSFSSPVLST